jgi:hypothetical protein
LLFEELFTPADVADGGVAFIGGRFLAAATGNQAHHGESK